MVRRTHACIGVILILLLLVCTTVVWASALEVTEKETVTVSFFDVGQGDAIFIETQNGTQVLIDGGKGRSILRSLGGAMSFFDRNIDVIVATHPDLDHIGGLSEVFPRYSVGMFIESGVRDDGVDNTHLHTLVKEEGLPVTYARRGQYLILDEGVFLEFVFPDRETTYLEANTASIIARLTFGETSFLFTGDAPTGIETYLASTYGTTLHADVLKLGHHGSKTSSSDVFLGYVAPSYAVISAGCDNPYGHPHEEVLEKLARFEIEMIDTCTHGTIVFESDGEFVTLK